MINTYNCTQAGANTGIGDCPLVIDKITGVFLVGKDFELTAANLASDATLLAALMAAAVADDPALRLRPVHGIVDIADNTADATEQTFGYGSSVVVADGFYNWTFPFLKGGLCLLKALQEFNSTDVRIIFYDSSGVLFGWKVGETLKGVPLNQFYANPWRPNTGAAVMITNFRVSMNPRYLNKEIGFVKVNSFSFEQIEGLQNVILKQTGVQAKPVYKITASTGCSGTSLYTFSAEMAVPANWIAKNATTGALIAITSVAVDANISGWTVTLDAADPDYPVIGSIILQWAPPSVLAAAGVVGYESIPLGITNA